MRESWSHRTEFASYVNGHLIIPANMISMEIQMQTEYDQLEGGEDEIVLQLSVA
jgi:hypothetical protein